MVDVQLVEVFPREIPLEELRGVTALAGMELLRRGSRLSVTPVTLAEFRTIEKLAHAKPPARPTRPAKPARTKAGKQSRR
jgi:predicted RNA-binding protein with PUA-like domain